MLRLLNRPFPFYLNDNGKNTVLIFFTSIFVVLFLIFYVPFENASHSILENFGWGICCFSTLYINLILLPKIFPWIFDSGQWTLLKYILFNVWLFLIMGILFSVVNTLMYCEEMTFVEVFLKTQKEVVLTGLIPLVTITVLARNELLKQNLADAIAINKKLQEIKDIKENVKPADSKTTIQTDTNETFSFNLIDLIYIRATDNYSEVYWKENGRPKKKLLRVTLKNVEGQLTNQFVLRCHRSYLINIREIESISGNANGYRLKMKEADVEIPVSRAKGKEIIAHIQQIRDLLDII
jgi:hypothetical protein